MDNLEARFLRKIESLNENLTQLYELSDSDETDVRHLYPLKSSLSKKVQRYSNFEFEAKGGSKEIYKATDYITDRPSPLLSYATTKNFPKMNRKIFYVKQESPQCLNIQILCRFLIWGYMKMTNHIL